MVDLPSDLRPLLLGGGAVEVSPGAGFRLTLPPTKKGYADAQIDDYRALARGRFPWSPPVQLDLRARASHPEPLGTLGFGFWNDPFSLALGLGGAARRLPAAPRAVWFFYGSPPNDLCLAPGVPGHGWKASLLTSAAVPALLLAPLAACAVLLARIPGLRRPIVQAARLAVKAVECPLDVRLDEWHSYALRWERDRAVFLVDGQVTQVAEARVEGPLGFVAWVDNQYAVASPEGGLRFGVIPTEEEQWLEIAALSLEQGRS
jgi:hypothetical protein